MRYKGRAVKPLVFIVDDDPDAAGRLEQALTRRYGAD
jgi:hypothetical protein